MASDKEKEPRNWKRSVLLYVHDLMCMLLAVMLLFLVVFRVILVTGDSMFSTLWPFPTSSALSGSFPTTAR